MAVQEGRVTPYADLRKQPRIPLSQSAPLPAPLTLYVEPTNACNFKCRCCPVGLDDYADRAGGKRTLKPDDAERVAEQVASVGGVRVLQWYMLGEPLANSNLPRFIRRFQGLADRQIVTTNGSLLDERRSLQLIDSGLDYLRVSVYGADQDDHAAETRSGWRLADVVQNVRRFRDLRGDRTKPRVYVKMIDAGEDRNARFRDTWTGVADEVEVEQRMDWNGSASFGGRDAPTTKQCCPFPFYTLVVHADLKVSPCCVDWDRRVVVGDLQAQTLSEIWNGSALHELRLSHLMHDKRHLDGCSTCDYFQANSPDDMDDLTADEYCGRLLNQCEVACP